MTLTLGGTAGSSDYTVNTSLASITIPANSTSATGTLELTPTDDAIVEGDETITILWHDHGVGPDRQFSATITLTDDDKSTTTPTDDKDTRRAEHHPAPSANVAEGSGRDVHGDLVGGRVQGSDRGLVGRGEHDRLLARPAAR